MSRLLRAILAHAFPGRFAGAGIVLVAYLALGLLSRLALLAVNGEAALWAPWRLLPIVGVGMLYDFAVGACWMLPFALLCWGWPERHAPRLFRAVAAVLAAGALCVFAFVAVAEFVFWNEFASRFNFIAVDYLIYSHEVLGNIRESYNLPALLAGVAALSLAMLASAWPALRRSARAGPLGLGRRSAAVLCFALLAVSSVAGVDTQLKEFTGRDQASQLAGNGQWEFFHALRNNEIDYHRFYAELPQREIERTLRAEFPDTPSVHHSAAGILAVERDVSPAAPARPLNVVLISVESFGAEFIASLGGKAGLTPNFERLAGQGLFFTHVYATGTRTVRGLEALTLSIPPTPGQAIPVRPRCDHLFSLGGVFKASGYEPLYLYGGYSYFDNMRAFFEGNGYTVADRTAIPSGRITHENVWGVADEDLFGYALDQLDQRFARGQRFFAHIMTTSNHRPFTYPQGRVDLPSHSGRDGAVKYTDYAIGKFIDDRAVRAGSTTPFSSSWRTTLRSRVARPS